MKRGGERLHRGSPGKAGSALSGSAFVYSGLPHVKLSECLFAILFSAEAKLLGIRIIWMFLIFPRCILEEWEGTCYCLWYFPSIWQRRCDRKDERRRGRDDTQKRLERKTWIHNIWIMWIKYNQQCVPGRRPNIEHVTAAKTLAS